MNPCLQPCVIKVILQEPVIGACVVFTVELMDGAAESLLSRAGRHKVQSNVTSQ